MPETAEVLIQRIRANIDLSRRLPRDQAEDHSLKALTDLAALAVLMKTARSEVA